MPSEKPVIIRNQVGLRIGQMLPGSTDNGGPGVPVTGHAGASLWHVSNQEAYAVGTAYLEACPEGTRDMRAPIDIGLKLIKALKSRGYRVTRETSASE